VGEGEQGRGGGIEEGVGENGERKIEMRREGWGERE